MKICSYDVRLPEHLTVPEGLGTAGNSAPLLQLLVFPIHMISKNLDERILRNIMNAAGVISRSLVILVLFYGDEMSPFIPRPLL